MYSGTSRTGAQPVARKSAPVRESAPIREGNMLGTEPKYVYKFRANCPTSGGAPLRGCPSSRGSTVIRLREYIGLSYYIIVLTAT